MEKKYAEFFFIAINNYLLNFRLERITTTQVQVFGSKQGVFRIIFFRACAQKRKLIDIILYSNLKVFHISLQAIVQTTPTNMQQPNNLHVASNEYDPELFRCTT